MGELIDKAAGAANSLTGKAKVAIGKQTKDGELIAKGEGQQAKGAVQNASGSVKGALGDKV